MQKKRSSLWLNAFLMFCNQLNFRETVLVLQLNGMPFVGIYDGGLHELRLPWILQTIA